MKTITKTVLLTVLFMVIAGMPAEAKNESFETKKEMPKPLQTLQKITLMSWVNFCILCVITYFESFKKKEKEDLYKCKILKITVGIVGIFSLAAGLITIYLISQYN
jgi:Na+/proline symporter